MAISSINPDALTRAEMVLSPTNPQRESSMRRVMLFLHNRRFLCTELCLFNTHVGYTLRCITSMLPAPYTLDMPVLWRAAHLTPLSGSLLGMEEHHATVRYRALLQGYGGWEGEGDYRTLLYCRPSSRVVLACSCL